MFYEFRQNNSGGRFIQDLKRGISHYVVVEADNYKEANDRAERIGLYFDGCDSGMDCNCCGDRWSPMWSDTEGQAVPSHYGTPVTEYKDKWASIWKEADHFFVHYKNGTIEKFQQVTDENGEGSHFKKISATEPVPKFNKIVNAKPVKKPAKKAAKKTVSKKKAKIRK